MGVFTGRVVRNGEQIDQFETSNLIVDQGLMRMLMQVMNLSSTADSWYFGLFNTNYTPVHTETAATIVTNAGEATDYTSTGNSNRPSFAPGVSGATIATYSDTPFLMTANDTIYGAFIISNPTKSSTAGFLYSVAQFSAPRVLVIGDTFFLRYSATVASA